MAKIIYGIDKAKEGLKDKSVKTTVRLFKNGKIKIIKIEELN